MSPNEAKAALAALIPQIVAKQAEKDAADAAVNRLHDELADLGRQQTEALAVLQTSLAQAIVADPAASFESIGKGWDTNG